MKIRMALACVLAGALVAVAAPASAAKTKGVRFEASLQRDFNLVGSGGMSAEAGPATGFGFGGGDPHGDIRIGYDLPFGFTPLLGLGFKSYSQEIVVTPDGDDAQTRSFSGTEFVLALEGRFYFKKHKKGLQPFVSLEYNTSFLSGEVASDVDGEEVGDYNTEEMAYRADANNHGEINIAFGTEYKFSQAFGIGGKWGLGIGLKGGDRNDPVGGDNQTVTRFDNNTIGSSAAVYAAWRL
jgi:hypothetical protein